VVGIVVAMEAELRHLLAAAMPVGEERDGVWLDRCAVVAGVPIIAVRSGIGLISAAAATERLIDARGPAAVLNIGCAGAR
jgi:adenosylhomocysteine nucleosidase